MTSIAEQMKAGRALAAKREAQRATMKGTNIPSHDQWMWQSEALYWDTVVAAAGTVLKAAELAGVHKDRAQSICTDHGIRGTRRGPRLPAELATIRKQRYDRIYSRQSRSKARRDASS